MKIPPLLAAMALTLASLGVYAEESHVQEALKHAEAAAKASDVQAITEHAEASRSHAKLVAEHSAAAVKSLDGAIEHGKLGHADLAKKSAEAGLQHLKAAQ